MSNQCYICYEECNNLSPCNCKNLYVHNKCIKKSVESLNKYDCTICNARYNNIVVNNKYIKIRTDFGKYICNINLISVISIITGCFQLYTYYSTREIIILYISLPFIFFSIVISLYTIIILFFCKNKCFYFKEITVIDFVV